VGGSVLSRASGAGMGEAASSLSLSLSVFGGSSQGQARQPSTRGRWPARAPPPPLSLWWIKVKADLTV
jgi:hypothetical protein